LELVGDQARKSGMKTVVLVNPLTAVVHLEPTSQIEPCTLGFSETNQNPLERRHEYIYIYVYKSVFHPKSLEQSPNSLVTIVAQAF